MRLLFTITGGAIVLILIITAIIFVLNNSYRKELPEYPDFTSVSVSIRKQISEVGRKAYLNPTTDNLGHLGMVYYSCTYNEKAKKCFQLAVKKNGKAWLWNYYLGYLDLEKGESKSSIGNFRSVIENDPKNYLAQFYLAEAYNNLGLIDSAEFIYKEIGTLDYNEFSRNSDYRENDFPLQTYALFRLARIYMISNRPDYAENTLTELIMNQKTFGTAYRLLGDVYTRQGNLTLGNRFTIRANDLAEYTPPSDMLIDNIALISRSDTYLLRLIDDAIHCGNYKWALKLCLHALKYMPDNKYVISKTLFGYFVLGYNDKAISLLDTHFRLYSDDYNELIQVADLLYSRGYDINAMKYFNQAKKLKPMNSRLALWLLERGMEDDAISLLNEQMTEDPENIKILSDGANIMLMLGNNEKAKEYLTTVKKLSPLNLDAKKLSGIILEREGDLGKALSIYEEAFQSNPKDLYIIRYLSALYIREKMWAKAKNHFRIALVNFPNEPFLLLGLGELLLSCPQTELRNVSEACEYLERAYINYKSTYGIKVSAGRDLAKAYAIVGEKHKASEYISLTTNLARQNNIPLDESYFVTLKEKYKLSD